MTNEIIKVNPVKSIQEKLYLQVITDACVETAALEICSKKKTKETVVRTFKNIWTVAVHCWYLKEAFAGFCQQILEKIFFSESILGKIDKNVFHA